MKEKPEIIKETCIYIIDENYRLINFNNSIKKLYPDLQQGQLCYKALCGEDKPCQPCTMQTGNNKTLFYNKMRNQWLECISAKLDWENGKKHTLIAARSIQEVNKNLFINATSMSAYDELYEINITNRTYQMLYCNRDIYFAPENIKGNLDEDFDNLISSIIYAEDVEKFKNSWNIKNIQDNLGKNKPLKSEFRRKKIDGSYGWVVMTGTVINLSNSNEEKIFCFVRDINEQKKNEMSTLALSADSRNSLTGLYKREGFIRVAEKFLKDKAPDEYCLMAVDIEHFKLFNEWYGESEGDKFLINIANYLKQTATEHNGVAGHIGADDFVIIMPNNKDFIEDIQGKIMEYARKHSGNAGFFPAFGMYSISNTGVPVATMYDRAVMAILSVKGNYAKRVCWYDSSMMSNLKESHKLLSEVQAGLVKNEFTFFVQPKCNMVTGRIIGLESLVRWIHPQKGMISPFKFIPMLEDNGLITNLDVYIWDKVCAAIRQWIDNGYDTVPVSVNVSRIDVYALDLVKHFEALVNKYKIPKQLLEIEITESAYSENESVVTKAVDDLRKEGFTVLMDDFGSGYSSLNMLKDVNVDVLKIDMRFLDLDENSMGKGFDILESVARMARMLDLKVIAEGVETEKQVKFLLDIGCVYAQGYYYYRPMPIEMVQSLLMEKEKIDVRGMIVNHIEQFHIKELMSSEAFGETMMNNILGGVAYFEVKDDVINFVRVNEQYYRITGIDPVSLKKKNLSFIYNIIEEDRQILKNIFDEAYRERIGGAEGEIRRRLENGRIIWLHMRIFFVKKKETGENIFYGVISDITEQKLKEYQFITARKIITNILAATNEVDAIQRKNICDIMHASGINNVEWDFNKNKLIVINKSEERLFQQTSLKFFEEEDGRLVINNFPEVILTREYMDKELISKMTEYFISVKNNIENDNLEIEFPLVPGIENSQWVTLSLRTVYDENNIPYKAVGYYKNISMIYKRNDKNKKVVELDTLTGLYNRSVAVDMVENRLKNLNGNSAAFVLIDLDNFKKANDNFGHAFGDEIIMQYAAKIKTVFSDNNTICRMGGDRFLIFSVNCSQQEMEEKLLVLLSEPLSIDLSAENKMQFSASAGYAMAPEQAMDFANLYEMADAALLNAKMSGKGILKKYNSSMQNMHCEVSVDN